NMPIQARQENRRPKNHENALRPGPKTTRYDWAGRFGASSSLASKQRGLQNAATRGKRQDF
ncbi:MAG: hypothetical protein MUF81_10045, partial [Verrucomicrobia bacterium]|nr:hypothetical protein [Verrucomicrobiota bacterium]